MSEDFFNNQDKASEQEPLVNPASMNIDDIQQTILQQMQVDEDDDSQDDLDSYESNPDVVETADTDYLENEYYDITSVEKKYVVAINPDNVPYFEELEPEERAKLVNVLLTAHQNEKKHAPEKERIQTMSKHVVVVVLTVAIGLPLIFNVVNISIEATLNSYRQVQYNFEKLYQQKGGVKRKDMTKMQNLQY